MVSMLCLYPFKKLIFFTIQSEQAFKGKTVKSS